MRKTLGKVLIATRLEARQRFYAVVREYSREEYRALFFSNEGDAREHIERDPNNRYAMFEVKPIVQREPSPPPQEEPR